MKTNIEHSEAFDELKRAVIYSRNSLFLSGIMLLLMGLGLLCFVPQGNLLGGRMLLYLVGVGLFIFGTFMLVQAARRWRLQNDPIMDLVSKKPEKVVWIYSYVVVNMPFGVRILKMATIYIYLSNGKQVTFRVREKKLKYVMLELNQAFPRATFGFSVEKEQLYRADPMMLRRSD